MTAIDTYLSLCTEVYDLSKPTPPKDAYDFYRSYAIAAQGRILEPMCGTGRFLLPLVAEGLMCMDLMVANICSMRCTKKLKIRI